MKHNWAGNSLLMKFVAVMWSDWGQTQTGRRQLVKRGNHEVQSQLQWGPGGGEFIGEQN